MTLSERQMKVFGKENHSVIALYDRELFAFCFIFLACPAMEADWQFHPNWTVTQLLRFPPEDENITFAIGQGVDYLRRSQLRTGSWITGVKGVGDAVAAHNCPTGFAALGGLTLLECGARKDDISVQQAARFVRANAGGLFRTYEVSLAAMFLDRLNQPGDAWIVRSLCLRLLAGQSPLGGWGYNCPILTPPNEKKLEETLRGRKKEDAVRNFAALTSKPDKRIKDQADNSNTQFAILAIWRASKHDLPLEFTIALVRERFRWGQHEQGWGYRLPLGGLGRFETNGTGSMTCVGLLGLAVAEGDVARRAGKVPKGDEKRKVESIQHALYCLGVFMGDPTDARSLGSGSDREFGPPDLLNYYFLWSVQRVGVLCNLETIGGRDWYDWGKVLILKTQRKDGSWLGRGSGGFPVVDTCFALLFLKRSDLLPDLRETLQKHLIITDPGKDGKGVAPKKSPGERPGDKKSPAETNDSARKPGASLDIPRTSSTFSTADRLTCSLTIGALDPNGTPTGGTLNVYWGSTLSVPAAVSTSTFIVANDGVINMYGGTISMNTTRCANLELQALNLGTASGTLNSYGYATTPAAGDIIAGNLLNNGLVRFLGSGLHTLTVSNDYTQGQSGTLSMRLNNSEENDYLSIGNAATLDGVLELTALNSLTAIKTWTLIGAITSRSGNFDTFDWPDNGAWLDLPGAVDFKVRKVAN